MAWAERKCYVETEMARKRTKKKTFSVVKAVKSNARDRVGQPKPERLIDDTPGGKRGKEKHKATLGDMLAGEE